MNARRILILSLKHGAGHWRASQALTKTLVQADPNAAVEVVDALEHCKAWFRSYYDSYQIPLRYFPALWGWIEGIQHKAKSTGPGWLYRSGARPLFRYLQANDPDAVVATEVGTCELAAMFKRETKARFRLIASPTGVDVDRAWAQPEVDLFITAPGEAADELAAAGVPAAKVLASGAPVDPAFHACPEQSAIRARLNVPEGVPLVLVLFGGAGFGAARRILPGLRGIGLRFEAVCVAGRNARLERQLRAHAGGDKRWRVFGWVNNMHEWMAAADFLVSKAGASTLNESLNCGLPLLAFDPLPGNERRACDLIEIWQAGRWARTPRELAATAEHWLTHPEELLRLRQNALSRARPRAAHDAAAAILKLAEGD